jgi:proline iminopeptidase
MRIWICVAVLLSVTTNTVVAFLNPSIGKENGIAKRYVKPAVHCWSALAASALDSSIPCKEGTVEVSRTINETRHVYNLSYKLHRPMSLSSRKAAPIVVLHGGPSVPSDYLYPLVKAVPYRSILFYDQLGCGLSDEPTDEGAYSIDLAVDDLEVVLDKVGLLRYHLYGQSFGGILAYEFLKRVAERRAAGNNDNNNGDDNDEGCLSVILSSTPTDVQQVEREAEYLITKLDSPTLFRETHQCRTSEIPQPLVDAYARAGTVWRGTSAIQTYVAAPPRESATRMPSCLVLRGEHDFVTPVCTEEWRNLFNSRTVRQRILLGCSHHGLLENQAEYGDTVDSFFSEYD